MEMVTTKSRTYGRSPRNKRLATTCVGAVVIGRNEGERLKDCLESLVGSVAHVVYVDSGSTDGSCDLAARMGVEVLSLDLTIPFTAARARNEGVVQLLHERPEIEFVQVVDGDCSVAADWIEASLQTLQASPDVAVVCGRRRERFPAATVYNRLCDMEWDGASGEVQSCGGDALIRVQAFRQAGGFDPSLIAGEEPEMCVRMRSRQWRIVRIEHDMTWHDAAMTRFGQWWKRATRSGHAYAEGHALHGGSPEAFRRHEVRSIITWGGVVPAVAMLGAIPTYGLTLAAAIVAYVRLYRRILKYRIGHGDSVTFARLYARFTVIGKLPQFVGLLQYRINRLRKKRSTLIEYK